MKQELIKEMIKLIGDDPNRSGLEETPERVIRSWKELYSGYEEDPQTVICKWFEEGSAYEGLVYKKNIEFFSTCEHHLLPFYGKAHIAYIPNGKYIGASKLSRLLDIYAKRLQIQERIGENVTDALMTFLDPKGAACIIEATHLCISCRGVRKTQSVYGYSSMKGVFLDHVQSRIELLQLLGL